MESCAFSQIWMHLATCDSGQCTSDNLSKSICVELQNGGNNRQTADV
jgi:hypothetical protein